MSYGQRLLCKTLLTHHMSTLSNYGEVIQRLKADRTIIVFDGGVNGLRRMLSFGQKRYFSGTDLFLSSNATLGFQLQLLGYHTNESGAELVQSS